MAYEPKPFPKWKYHKSEKPVIVNDEESEAKLGDVWYDSPDFKEESKPESDSAEPEKESSDDE